MPRMIPGYDHWRGMFDDNIAPGVEFILTTRLLTLNREPCQYESTIPLLGNQIIARCRYYALNIAIILIDTLIIILSSIYWWTVEVFYSPYLLRSSLITWPRLLSSLSSLHHFLCVLFLRWKLNFYRRLVAVSFELRKRIILLMCSRATVLSYRWQRCVTLMMANVIWLSYISVNNVTDSI